MLIHDIKNLELTAEDHHDASMWSAKLKSAGILTEEVKEHNVVPYLYLKLMYLNIRNVKRNGKLQLKGLFGAVASPRSWVEHENLLTSKKVCPQCPPPLVTGLLYVIFMSC